MLSVCSHVFLSHSMAVFRHVHRLLDPLPIENWGSVSLSLNLVRIMERGRIDTCDFQDGLFEVVTETTSFLLCSSESFDLGALSYHVGIQPILKSRVSEEVMSHREAMWRYFVPFLA